MSDTLPGPSPAGLECEQPSEGRDAGLQPSAQHALDASARGGESPEGKRTEGQTPAGRRWLSPLWLPPALVTIAAGLLYLGKPGGVAESPVLLTTLNALFVVATSLAVAYLAAHTYLKTDDRAMLALGCAALSLGVIYALAGPLVARSVDAALALHNGGLLLTAALFVVSAVWCVKDRVSRGGRPGRPIWILLPYAATVLALGLLTWSALAGMAPAFFVPGHGVTALRNAVLASATAGFVIAALLLRLSYRKTGSRFLGWYSIGLAMFAIGLGTVWLGEPGSAISWLGRAAQYAAGAYMLVAILSAVEESGSWSITLSRAIRESERRFQSLFESMTEGVALHELVYDGARAVDYRLLDVNPSFERQTGIEVELARDRLASDLYGTGAAPYLLEYLKVAESGEPCSFETYFEPLRRHFRITAVSLGGARFATVFDDITERKRAMEALRDSEQRLRRMGEAGRIGLYEWNLNEDSAYWSPEAYVLFGVEPGPPVTFQLWLRCVHPDDRERCTRSMAAIGREGGAVQGGAVQGDASRRDEYRVVHADGTVLWLEAVTAFDHEDGDRILRGAVRDVTERKQAEQALRESEARYRSLFSTMQEAFFVGEVITDEAGAPCDYRIIEANEALELQTGVALEQYIGNTALGMYPDLAPFWPQTYGQVALTGEPARFDSFVPQQDRHYDVTAYQTGPRQFAALFLDVTEQKRAAEALKRQAELLDLSSDAMIVWQLGGRIESWNRGAEELYGYSGSEALGRLSHDLLATIHQRPWPQIEATLREHGHWEGEVRHRTKDGREIVISTRHQLIRGGDGVERVLETNRDISDRKRAEEALRLSEQRLREAQRVAHIGSWEWDMESGALSWSPELYEIYALDPDAFTPTMESFSGFVHPADRGLVDSAVGQILASGGRTDFEFRIIAGDGSVRELHAVGEVTAWNEEGGPRLMVGVNEDVTERRRAERALRESEVRLRRFYEAGLLGVMYWNTDGEILDANDRFLDMVGYTREELAAEEIDWLEMTPPEFAYLDEHSLAELEADGVNSAPFEKEYRRKDGTRVPVIVAGAMLDDDRRVGVAFVLDITDRKRAEEALRESEAERVAHQERSRLARDLHDSVTQALFAATMKAEALSLADDTLSEGTSRLAEDVRRLSRGALAQMRTLLLELRGDPLEDVPLGTLLRHLVEAAEARASVNVQLTIRGDAQVPPTLHAPIYRITQEALNNVTRHAGASKCWVDLDVEPDAVRLVVGDDGCGFEPSACDPSHIGLRSMRERAEEADAQFDIVTQLGGGTVVTVAWQMG
jgi:PAS domain S-box-containing protein